MRPILLILQIFRDLIIRYLPFRVSRKYRFAFLVHSRDIDDVYRKFPFAKKMPDNLIKWWCYHSWPIIVSKVRGLYSERSKEEVSGYVIGIPMTARQMLENRELAVHRIIQACKLAEKMGIRIVGLGALTSSVSGGGLFFADRVNVGITTGHALTCANIISVVLAVIKEFNYKIEDVSIAIVGAAGSVGSACASLLTQKGIKNLLLVDLDRKNEKLDKLIKDLRKSRKDVMNIRVSHQINDIKTFPIVITATNAPEALVKSEDLSPGAIIVDDAQPSDIDVNLIKQRKDVIIIDGGVIKTPGISSNFNFGLADQNDNFACLVETICLAAINWIGNYNIGRTDLNKVKEIKQVADSLNFYHADFQHQGLKYSKKDIQKIKKIINKNA